MDKLLQRFPPYLIIWTIVIVLALTWGSSFLILKYSLNVFNPGQVFAGRMFFGALVLMPFAFRHIRKISTKQWVLLAIFTFVTNFCTTYLNALAQSQITSSLNGILSSLTPLMTLFIGFVIYKTPLKRPQLFALLLGLGGAVSLIIFGQGGALGNINLYAMFAVAAALCVGISTNMIRYHFSELTPVQISSMAFLIIFPFALGYAIQADFFTIALANDAGIRALQEIIFLGVISNAAAIVLFTKLVEISSPVFASMVTYLMPIVAVAWGIWDGETVSAQELIAMGIIIVSIWLVNRFSR